MKILLAEDDFLSRKLMNIHLSAYGEVDIAANGIEAVEACRLAMEDHKPYELLCLDIMMPGKDGLAALKEIRQLEQTHHIKPEKRCKAIITTALGEKKYVIEAARSQCDAYLIKPVTKSKLEEELVTLGFAGRT